MNKFDDNFDGRDDLWQLLGKAKTKAVSPLFSRNVLRAVRQSRAETAGIFSWWKKRWVLASACTLAAVLLSLNASRMLDQVKVHSALAPAAVQASDASKPDDPVVIAHLDELVAYDENSVWLEDSSN